MALDTVTDTGNVTGNVTGTERKRGSVRHYDSLGSRVFDILNVTFLLALAAVTVLPLLYVLAGSFATEAEIDSRPFFLWPEKFITETYDYIFSTDTFLRALLTTITVTTIGTLIQVALTLTMAYPLSKRHLPGRTLALNIVIFTLVFSGGMIPTYLVVRNLGLLDSYWALILPLAINPFYLIIVKSFFQELPEALEEAARIDGCKARRLLAHRASVVQTHHRDVLAVLRGRDLERLHVATALHQRRAEVDAAGAGPAAHRAQRRLGERAQSAGVGVFPPTGREVRDHRARDAADPAGLSVSAEALRQGCADRIREGMISS